MSTYQSTKPSKLEEFKLFYESVPAPDYLERPIQSENDKKPQALRDRKLARKRK